MKELKQISIPTEQEIKDKLNDGEKLTALEIFILGHQPRDGSDAEVFRSHLEAIITEMSKNDGVAPEDIHVSITDVKIPAEDILDVHLSGAEFREARDKGVLPKIISAMEEYASREVLDYAKSI